MSSPSEKYASFRSDQEHPAVKDFRALYDFELDEFQLRACAALEDGHQVLVAAPTGSGKTLVGEFAVHLALQRGQKCFYTTPIKALSNQKYGDLVSRYGAEKVGLLTGDNSINSEAPIVVMTTEVLRNMLYAGSNTLLGLSYVVMDEVHYLADRARGAVWEEVLIHLPDSVSVVSLSATVSNAEEFGDWLETVRGNTVVVLEEKRPVPLFQHVMVGKRLHDLFAGEAPTARVGAPAKAKSGNPAKAAQPDLKDLVNPQLVRIARDDNRIFRDDSRKPRRRRDLPKTRPSRTHFTPYRSDVVEELDAGALLPAIYFIFSRKGCEDAMVQCLRSGLKLTKPHERDEIKRVLAERTADLPDEDLGVLGYHDFAEALSRGIAAHHAGMLAAFKEVVEELFARGLIKVVFATETLALGINMPARTVVLEKLSKWNGEAHVDITPGEYTQLTGRAGRRGIDVEGHAVVLWQPGFDPRAVAGLASTRTYPLRSSFSPSYNMAVNLVRQVGRNRARDMLELSFAQFQSDQAVVGLARQVQRNTEALEGYKESIDCHLGDFLEYAELRRRIGEREASGSKRRKLDRRIEAQESIEKLRIGDIIRIPAGRSAGWALVLDPGMRSEREGPRPTVLTLDRQVRKLSMVDFPTPVEAIGTLRVPRKFNPRNPQQRRELAQRTTRCCRRCGRSCGRTRATAARTARTMPAGPSGTSGSTGRTVRCSGRSSNGRTPSPGSSTGSARCWTRCTTWTVTRPPRPATGCRGSTPSSTWWPLSACGRVCSTTCPCRSWLPAWPRWSMRRGRRTSRPHLGCRGATYGRRSSGWVRSGGTCPRWSVTCGSTSSGRWISASAGPRSGGRRARRWPRCCTSPTWPPGTSSAGSSSSSTSPSRSPTPPVTPRCAAPRAPSSSRSAAA
jgi:ATP-dependent RNA helicase HelY